jgi:hypothetical protein
VFLICVTLRSSHHLALLQERILASDASSEGTAVIKCRAPAPASRDQLKLQVGFKYNNDINEPNFLVGNFEFTFDLGGRTLSIEEKHDVVADFMAQPWWTTNDW